MNHNPEKSPSRRHLCKQEAESPSVGMEGLEQRFEVLLEGLLMSLCLLQVLKPLLSAFLLLGLDGIQSAGPPAHRAAAGRKECQKLMTGRRKRK